MLFQPKYFLSYSFVLFLLYLQICNTKKIPEPSSCNEEIGLKDWGFLELASGRHSDWSISGKDLESLDYQFVSELDENFLDQNVYGFYALMVKSGPKQAGATLFLNQTVQFGNYSDDFPEEYYFSMRLSVLNQEIEVSIYIDENFLFHKYTTFPGVFQEKSTFQYPLTKVDGYPHNISIQVEFFYQAENTVYLDDIQILRYLNATDLRDNSPTFVSSVNGSDMTGDGSIHAPFSSVQMAINNLGLNSEVVVLPGLYCGLGNSWIDPSQVLDGPEQTSTITITGSDPNNKPVFSGEDLTNIIDYEAWGYFTTKFQGLILQNPNTKPNGALLNVAGATDIFLDSIDFVQSSATNQTIFLNYLNTSTFIGCTFQSFCNTYMIQAEGVWDEDNLIIKNCTFNSNAPLDLLQIQNIRIHDSFFYAPDIYDEVCGVQADLIDNFDVTNTLISIPICVTETNLTIRSSEFSNFFSQLESILLAQDSNVLFSEVSFHNISVTNMMQSFRGSLTLQGCSILNDYGQCIHVQNGALLFQDSVIRGPGDAIDLDGATALFLNSTFIETTSFLLSTQSVVNITKCILRNCSQAGGNLLYSSTVTSYANLYTQNNNDFFILSDDTMFEDYGSTYTENYYASFIYSKSCAAYLYDTVLTSNHFQSIIVSDNMASTNMFRVRASLNTADSGPIATLLGESAFDAVDCLFTQNKAYGNGMGGVFLAEDFSTLNLTDCTATFNHAEQGGVIAATSNEVNVTLEGGVYVNNTATQGGVVYYVGPIPVTYTPIVITNNTGSDLVLGKSAVVLVNKEVLPNSVDSGQNLFSLVFQLRDAEDGTNLTNKVCHENDCLLYFFVSGLFLQSKTILADGSVTFNNLVLSGPIGSTQSILVYSNDDSIQPFRHNIGFNTCPPGSLPGSNNELCVLCSAGTYGMNGQNCTTCPANVICIGGNSTVADVGYWLDVDPVAQFVEAYQCPPDVCLTNNTCAPNYQGPLCSECVDGYYNCGAGCQADDSINIPVLGVRIVMFFGLVLAQQISSDASGLIPIALYFMQTLAVVSSGVKFSLVSVLSGASSSSTRSSSKASILSYLNACIGPISFFWNHYFVMGQPVFLVVILAVIIAIEFLLRVTGIIYKIPVIKGLVSNSHKEFTNRQFSAFIKIMQNSYGPFLTEMLLILFCEQVGPYTLLIANPGVQCLGSSYQLAIRITWILFPVIILFPLIIFVLLYRVRNKLEDQHVERKFGVFYLKYKKQFYFWDVLLLFKRFSIVILSLLSFDSNMRSISLVLLCLFYLFLQVKYQPFLSGKDNYLETISLALLFVACIYLDNGLWAVTGQWVLIGCVVIFGVVAIKLQGKHYWNEFMTKASPVFQKIREFCSCCFSNIKKGRRKILKKKLVDYDSENDDENDQNQSSTDYYTYTDDEAYSQKFVGKVDQRNLLSNTYSITYDDDDETIYSI